MGMGVDAGTGREETCSCIHAHSQRAKITHLVLLDICSKMR